MIRTTSPSVAGAAARRSPVVTRGRSLWPAGNRSSSRARSAAFNAIRVARTSDCTVSTRVGPATGTTSGREIQQPGDGDLERCRARDSPRDRRAADRIGPAPPLRSADRAIREQRDAVRDAVLGHAVQKVLVLPDAQLDLNRRDLGDVPGLLDLADVHIAEANRLDVPIPLERRERADAGRERRSRIGGVQLIQVDALDAERAPARLAGGDRGAAPARRLPTARRAA